MPVSSTYVSGLIGGQQAMFANNMAFSQQLSGVYGTGPQMPMQAMQNPFPSYQQMGGYGGGDAGVGMAGAVGSAMPLAMTGMAIAGGFRALPLPGGGGFLDPFTAGAGGFARASGLAGSGGFRAGLARLGTMGFGGGARAVAAGLGGAALSAAPMLAIGAGVQAVGENIHEGAQLVGQVGQIAERFGPAYGQAGVRPGGHMARSQIQAMTTVLHELADENVLASVKDMVGLMDKFSRTGMMAGVTDAATFKQRFSSLVRQVDTVAKILGTSLDEAAPILGQMNRMGIWTAQDVMGTSFAMKTVGPEAAPQLMRTMQAGAQMAYQQGGNIGAGARMGQRTFMDIQAASQAGALTNEQIMNFTGGVGGVEGQRAMATQLTGVVSNMANTPVGNLMLAALGEIEGTGKDRRFTGGIDKELFGRFQSGQISIGELQRMGQGRINNRNLAAGFMLRRGQIGQAMGAEGGLEGILQAVTQGAAYGGFSQEGEDVQTRLLQMMMGVDERTALALADLGKDMPRIMEQKRRRARDAIDDTFRDLDRRMNHSWQGFKDAMSNRAEQFWRPFQEFGGRLATQIGEDIDSFVNETVFGYQAPIRVGTEERRRILARGGPQVTAAQLGMGQPGAFDRMGMVDAMRSGGVIGAAAFLKGDYGGVVHGEVLAELGQRTRWGGEEGRAGEVGLVRRRGGATLHADEAQTELARRRAMLRGADRSLETLGMEENDPDLITVKTALNKMMLDPNKAKAMRALKEKYRDNPARYQKEVLRELYQGEAKDAIRSLVRKRKPKAGMADVEALDVLAAADTMAGGMPTGTNLEWERTSALLGGLPQDPEALTEIYNKNISDAAITLQQGALAESSAVTWGGRIGGAVGGLLGAALTPLTGGLSIAAGAAGGYKLGQYLGKAGANVPSEGAIKEALMDGELGPALAEWLKSGDAQASGDFAELLTGKDTPPELKRKANQIFELMGNLSPEQRKTMGEQIGGAEGAKQYKVQVQAMKDRATAATKERRGIAKLRGKVSQSTFDEYNQILELQESGNWDKQQEANSRMAALSSGLSDKEQKALFREGGSFAQAMALSGRAAGMIKAGMREGDWEKTRGQIAGVMGIDVFEYLSKEQKDVMTQAIKGGLTADEARQLRDMVTNIGAKLGGTEGKTAMEETNQRLLEQLRQYTQANSQFVEIAAAGIAKMTGTDVEDLKALLPNLRRDVTNPTEQPS